MTRYHQLSKSKCFSETTGRPPLMDPVSFGIAPILRLAIFMFALLTLVS